LSNWTALATETVRGKESNKWTWSAAPQRLKPGFHSPERCRRYSHEAFPGCPPGSLAVVLRSQTPHEPSNMYDCETWFQPTVETRIPTRVYPGRVSWDSQPSLTGLNSSSDLYPGLASWATLSRPYGTQFGEGSSHADSEAQFSLRLYGPTKACPDTKPKHSTQRGECGDF
jgi:hypothetical protein